MRTSTQIVHHTGSGDIWGAAAPPSDVTTATIDGCCGGYVFAGTIAELALYAGALDPIRIAAHAALEAP